MSRILVIDSANLFIQYVDLAVNRYGYSTTGVASAREAVRLLEKEPFDLVIAQETLPDLSWSEFSGSIKTSNVNVDIPVVVLSSEPDAFDDSMCKDINLAKVGTGPVSMSDLLEVIGQYIPFHNRRRGIRASLPIKALIRDGGRSVPCQILNLSEGGVFVMKKKPHPMGAPVELLIALQDTKAPLGVRGKVVYVVETARGKHPRGMGIQFDELKKGVGEKLRLYIDDHIATMLGR